MKRFLFIILLIILFSCSKKYKITQYVRYYDSSYDKRHAGNYTITTRIESKDENSFIYKTERLVKEIEKNYLVSCIKEEREEAEILIKILEKN